MLTTKGGNRYRVDRVRRRDDRPDVLFLESRISPGVYFEVMTNVAQRENATIERDCGE